MGPALREVPGVEQAFLFGSWAARYLGEPGDEPADLDVMVIGRPSRRTVARVAKELSERLGREVNATIVPAERWRETADGFVRQVQRGPLVEVELARA